MQRIGHGLRITHPWRPGVIDHKFDRVISAALSVESDEVESVAFSFGPPAVAVLRQRFRCMSPRQDD